MSNREYFNQALGKVLATADKNGRPNACLCGSAFMLNDATIACASGFFDRTESNIRETKRAVFMAFKSPTPEFWKHYEETGEQLFASGIRFYCEYKDSTASDPLLGKVRERLRGRVGDRVANGMKELWLFKVVEVRPLDF